MRNLPRLSKKMFESLADIEAGRFVFAVARKASDGGEASIEDVIVGETLNPRLVLERHCKSRGIPQKDLLCLPVILPPGLQPVAVKGFRPVRTATALWIEYTGEK